MQKALLQRGTVLVDALLRLWNGDTERVAAAKRDVAKNVVSHCKCNE